MDEDVARYWQKFEEETGERVEVKGVAEVYEGTDGPGAWCLVVLTDRNLWFRQMPSSNWIASLFQGRSPVAASRRPDRDLKIPRGSILSLDDPGSRKWFSSPAFPVLTLAWREGEAVRNCRFSLDPSTDLRASLRKLF